MTPLLAATGIFLISRISWSPLSPPLADKLDAIIRFAVTGHLCLGIASTDGGIGVFFRTFLLACVLLVILHPPTSGQGVRVSVPYDGQLRTDPDVGNVQGIQRYGRPLRTDPDQGDGFSYHVYPVAEDSLRTLDSGAARPTIGAAATFRGAVATDAAVQQGGVIQPESLRERLKREIADAKAKRDDLNLSPEERDDWGRKFQKLTDDLDQLDDEVRDSHDAPTRSGSLGTEQSASYTAPWASPYPPAFDWTGGIRNFELPPAPLPGSPADVVARGVAITRGATGYTTSDIYHQPLIQIKVRVVEVVRGDSFNAGTILEFVSMKNGVPTLTTGQSLNTTGQNTRAISRLPLIDLATTATAGTGTLANLTSEHINFLVQLLATEVNADVVTAPEVVTLNGQNVEFVAGEKLPFQLGQNVIQGQNNNIQQFFYKHVGTMISVTPRIVNWGLHGEGQGEKPILADEIVNWPRLVKWMSGLRLNATKDKDAIEAIEQFRGLDEHTGIIPFSAQGSLLRTLNGYSRQDVQRIKGDLIAEMILDKRACDECTTWSAEDCTIDVSVVVRISSAGEVEVQSPDLNIKGTSEKNVRAISNVIQLKSGNGVVMAGLIGERETEELAKVPLLGDMPVVGFFFRNKALSRQKTELLIFVEAKVLDPDPVVARAESSHDFLLGHGYVDGEFLDNPLELGMHRVGFGSYLPPTNPTERIYWERFGRKLRKIATHTDDMLE